jgi:hypothetical protein
MNADNMIIRIALLSSFNSIVISSQLTSITLKRFTDPL